MTPPIFEWWICAKQWQSISQLGNNFSMKRRGKEGVWRKREKKWEEKEKARNESDEGRRGREFEIYPNQYRKIDDSFEFQY